MFRFKPVVLAPFFLGLVCASAYAQPVTQQAPRFRPRMPMRGLAAEPSGDFIIFRSVDNFIDCETLGTPFLVANYQSKVATIEVDSSVDMKVQYATGANLTNGAYTLPTTFQFAVLGVAMVNDSSNDMVGNPQAYTTFDENDGPVLVRKANEAGEIRFPANLPYVTKGLKARVLVKRRGLQDQAGNYSTQVVLNWLRW